MAGVGVLSSLGLFLLLLIARFSAAREERSPRQGGWKKVEENVQKNYNYLALLESDDVTVYCSGSIASASTVLTYCTMDPKTAYAGVLNLADLTNIEAKDIQRNEVKEVQPQTRELNALKICFVKDNWKLNDKVGIVTLRLDEDSGRTWQTCTVLGFRIASGRDRTDVAHVMTVASIGDNTVCQLQTEDDPGLLYSTVADPAKEKLDTLDVGGPVVCSGVQRGINKVFQQKSSNPTDCNLYINIAKYSPWIKEQIKAAEETGAAGGTGGNGTSPSSGYSIHSYLNKYSNWKVLAFLVPTIVTFLQY